MSTLTSVITFLITILFIVAPVWLTIAVIYRYNKVERAVVHYTAMLRVVMAYLEGRQRTVPPLPAPEEPQTQPSIVDKMLAFFYKRAPDEWLDNLKLRDEYDDYLAIVRHGIAESERYMRLKRKNLTMQQSVTADVEFCRTYTEILPYMGILGTVLGFFFSPAIFLPGATVSVTIGGLVVALTSTAAALACILVIKMGYENRVIPKAIEFEQSLQVLEDYARRYGDLDGSPDQSLNRNPEKSAQTRQALRAELR
jgi:hypothetical protein